MQQPHTPVSTFRLSARVRRLALLSAGVCVAALAVVPLAFAASANADNPRGLTQYAPVYQRAVKGLEAPLGFTDCEKPTTLAGRETAGGDRHAVSPVIDRFIIHHTGTTEDQLDYFSHCNDRSSAPTFYLRGDGSVFEMIRPGAKPASTGADWNWRSLAVETLNATGTPDYLVTAAQMEELAQMIAWLATFDGQRLDGVPVSFTIDRNHVLSHQEAVPGTECPGPYLQDQLDAIVERAQEIFKDTEARRVRPESAVQTSPDAGAHTWHHLAVGAGV